MEMCQPAIRSGGRVLGIDAGERRVGLALSDELGLLATPLAVLHRDGGLASVMKQISEITTREGVVFVVVGLPLNQDGSAGRQARRAEAFASIVRRALGLPVQLWDERLSTVEAMARARAIGYSVRRLRERGTLDALAAAVILQEYLDSRKCEQIASRGE